MSWEMEKVTSITPFMKFLFRCAQESGPLSPEAEKDYILLPWGFSASSTAGFRFSLRMVGQSPTALPFPIFVILSRLSLHCLSTGWERLHVVSAMFNLEKASLGY